MQWISFVAITGLFSSAVIENIINRRELDKTLAGVFIIVVGFAWGANIAQFISKKLK